MAMGAAFGLIFGMMDVEDRITAALVPVGLRQQVVHGFGGRICFNAKLRHRDFFSSIGQCRHFGLGAVHIRHQSPCQGLALANLPFHGVSKLARTARGLSTSTDAYRRAARAPGKAHRELPGGTGVSRT